MSFKILNQNQVVAKLGIGSVHTFNLNFYKGSQPVDPRFPQKRAFGKSLIGWLESDIDEYMKNSPQINTNQGAV